MQDEAVTHSGGGANTKSAGQLDFEIEFYSGILRRHPNYVEVLRIMSNNLTAKGDYVRCLDYDRRLTLLCPHDRVAHYNLACSYSLLEMLDPALDSLRCALKLGFCDYAYLRKDRDLEALRKDARFEELLKTFGIGPEATGPA